MFDTATTSPSGRTAVAGPEAVRPSLTGLVELVDERLGDVRAESWTGEQAVAVVEAMERMVRRCQAVQLMALGRVAATGAWKADGSRSAPAWAARTLGVGFRQATSLVETSERLAGQPHLDRVLATGSVPVGRVVAASRVAAQVPAAEETLAQAAESCDPGELRATCRRVREAHESPEDRSHRHRASRRATSSVDDEGMFEFRAFGPPGEGVEFESLFRPWVDDALRDAVRAGSVGADIGAQSRWDALLAMARAAADRGSADADEAGAPPAGSGGSGPGGGSGADGRARAGGRRRRPASLARGRGSRVKVIVRVDLTALQRGHVLPGELCDVAGLGPVDVDAVRQLIDEGAFVAAVVTDTDADTPPPGPAPPDGSLAAPTLVAVAHLGRFAPDDPSSPASAVAGVISPSRSGGPGATFVDRVRQEAVPVGDLVHDHRAPDAAQRTALEFAHPTCSAAGCTMAFGLEIDHVDPWVDTHETRLTDLDRKCRPHHRAKTAEENGRRKRPPEAFLDN